MQRELEALNAESVSYVAGLWDSMYLEIRDSNMINVSPYLMLKDDPRRTDQFVRAASIAHFIGEFTLKIRQGSLAPDMDKDTPMDMSQYEKLFGTARIPALGRDKCITYADASTLVVMSNNKFYTLNLLGPNGVLSEAEIVRTLSIAHLHFLRNRS